MAKQSGKRREGYPILVVGGGIAGIVAALDLANLDQKVHVVEKNRYLGGQVGKLDKLYPTDHCAFCPTWTEVKKCREHLHITVHTRAHVKGLSQEGDRKRATIVKRPSFIEEEKCVFCGRCVKVCPVEKELRNMGNQVTLSHAITVTWDHAFPPSYWINENACTKCGLCQEICPTEAIDLNRTDEEIVLTIEDVIWATGFHEVDLSRLEELGGGSHPDIMSAMEFEEWISEAGPNRGHVRKRSNLSVPHSVAFVQCAGARDKRMLPYCAAVCCMHALKQARWIKRRSAETMCTLFYTDLRTVGKNYYKYALDAIREGDIELIRGRPSMILPLPDKDGIAIKYENTLTQKTEIRGFDMAVLNGALQPSLCQLSSEEKSMPLLDSFGFVNRRTTGVSTLACGFSIEPTDVIESVIQASSAASKAIQRLKRER